MEQEENQQSLSPISVLSRLDRLDRLVHYLEEKQSMSRRQSTTMKVENQCKPLSTALDELHAKGTLMERVAMLEKSVLQLSLDMEEWNTSNSSSNSSIIAVCEDVSRHDHLPTHEHQLLGTLNQKQGYALMQESGSKEPKASKPQSYKKGRRRTTSIGMGLRPSKWLGCFQTNTLNLQ